MHRQHTMQLRSLLLIAAVAAAAASPLDADCSEDELPTAPVSYRDFQLWSVTPETQEQRDILYLIQQGYGWFFLLFSIISLG